MATLDEVLEVLELEEVGPGSYRAQHVTTNSSGVVFGGQLLAQSVVAASAVDPEKVLKTLHTVFARSASPAQPLEIDVETMHRGRALASATVTVRQGERLCARSIALLSVDEPDLVRHQPVAPEVPGPDEASPADHDPGFWEVRIVGGVDLADPDAVGPAELGVWSRFPGGPTSGPLAQGLVAYATDGFLIGTAMRPHAGVGQSLAHVTVDTNVLSHTLTFHEPVDASRWHLLAQESDHAGHGRAHGRGLVFDEDGLLVASFVQDSMLRAAAAGA